MRLAGHHALVTGAGTGIGKAIAEALGAEGASLSLVGRRADKLAETVRDCGAANAFPADVTNRDEVDVAFDAARAASGPITILVNNAGAAVSKPFAQVGQDDWRAAMAVNLDALLHCCQAAMPDLVDAEDGRIVTIASSAGVKGFAYSAPYCAAKHGAVGLMRALAAEYAKTGLTANAVCPGFTDTGMVAEAAARVSRMTGRSEDASRAALTAFNPQGRLIAPHEVAATVVWLCLPESRSINGQAIQITGGET